MFNFLVKSDFSVRVKSIFMVLMYLPLIWCFSGMLIYPSADKTQVILVLLAIISSFIVHDKKTIIDNVKQNQLAKFLLFLTIGAVFLKLLHGYSSSVIRAFSGLLLYFAFIPKSTFSSIKNKLPALLLLSGIISFVYGFWFTYVLELGRAWSINPIPYSTVSVAIGVGSLYFLFSNASKQIQRMMLLSFALSLNVIIFSQARGTALALCSVAALVILFAVYSKLEIRKQLTYIFLIVIVSLLANTHLIQNRIDFTANEMQRIESSDMNSSIGLRFQMWKAAVYLIKEKPLLGYGDDHKQAKQLLADQGIITQDAVPFTHYHNEFISDWALDGLTGVVMLLLMLYLPFFLFKKTVQQHASGEKFTSLCRGGIRNPYIQQSIAGIFIVLGYAVAALTDVPFQHAVTISFYLASCAVIFFGCEDLTERT